MTLLAPDWKREPVGVGLRDFAQAHYRRVGVWDSAAWDRLYQGLMDSANGPRIDQAGRWRVAGPWLVRGHGRAQKKPGLRRVEWVAMWSVESLQGFDLVLQAG